MFSRACRFACVAVLIAPVACAYHVPPGSPPLVTSETSVTLHGHSLRLHLSKPATGEPGPALLVYATGDAGWWGKDREIFTHLATWGYPAVGFSAREYVHHLGNARVHPADVAGDYTAIIGAALSGLGLPSSVRPVLVGKSRGAGLSVAAAVDPPFNATMAGVLAVGLTREEEYVHGRPHQPPERAMLQTYARLDDIGSVPVAVIQSTNDQYIPASEARQLFGPDTNSRELVPVISRDHNFGGAVDRLYQEMERSIAVDRAPMMRIALACVLLLAAIPVQAAEKVGITLRGKALTLELYRPPAGTVAERHGPDGQRRCRVGGPWRRSLGIPLRTGLRRRRHQRAPVPRGVHLGNRTCDPRAGVCETMRRSCRRCGAASPSGIRSSLRACLKEPALAVLAGADKSNRTWVKGVLTMGLPPTAELAWRWTDITSWITKKDAAEPSFEPLQFIAAIAPDSALDDPVHQGRIRQGSGLPRIRAAGGTTEAAGVDRRVQPPLHGPAAASSPAGAGGAGVDPEPELTRLESAGVRTRAHPPATSADTYAVATGNSHALWYPM